MDTPTTEVMMTQYSQILTLRSVRGLETPANWSFSLAAVQNRHPMVDPLVLPDSPLAPGINSQIHRGVSWLMEIVHAAQRKAGWWTDLETGLDKQRNIAELLALVGTEIAEAAEGYAESKLDDKLPEFKMHCVEIADAQIRVYDLAAVYAPALAEAMVQQFWGFQDTFATLSHPLNGVMPILRAVESARKKRPLEKDLADFLIWSYRHAHVHQLNLHEAFAKKFLYNQSRADHTLAARKAEGGKSF